MEMLVVTSVQLVKNSTKKPVGIEEGRVGCLPPIDPTYMWREIAALGVALEEYGGGWETGANIT
jgi:hypothetical protein